ncbi:MULTISPECIES: hypothetical protein [Micromonospora]|uniref:Uncharacterized protein n=1 Tax=Micromonospora sicca TaxID=2202420 RepID=A0ABU5JMR4_9ACTN|nr:MULTISPECIES: hypothetical protein [unclassified Micromonospora]MBM0228215.1 hypothetical protein [Micromonospora sp. ATA51]MDZ5447220.1 hypothetical protein [Micromonospora sp. 4G57]MDZ5493913.1 hypothetical protein [Micromonospora sp. 4G53]
MTEEPLRYEMSMKPGFGQKYTREQAIGSPIKQSLNGDVMTTGIIVDWIDEADGSVTLVIEQRDLGLT